MSLTQIEKVRLLVGDNDPALPILTDVEYEYFLESNSQSIRRSALQAAQVILYKLSMRTRSTVDIFDVHGQQAAQNYIQALKLFLRNPDLNTILQNAGGYVGGVSVADMQANDSNADNNIVKTPLEASYSLPKTFFDV